ncbi:28S ribosomal protein S28, mitochondrial [Sitophilus oryzae]|uniref:28S ribosomal protein S28, mitochondrial n=1 Tax=Sitophilus oryzae TaxID=7048 RepID=A0A6J2XPU9_SITOR|nr:28S ribosomal protein S28, mitochondrial [Sitophilus oryzae]
MFRNCFNKLTKLRNLNYNQYNRLLSVDAIEGKETNNVGGYAESFKKFETINETPKEAPQTFASLLKNSKFIDLGDPEGKVVLGKIFHIVEDDLYIDFGWKFHCVCPRPEKNASNYKRGAKVRLRIKQLELSSKFLGYEKDLTLLEADCALLGLVHD